MKKQKKVKITTEQYEEQDAAGHQYYEPNSVGRDDYEQEEDF
jgi:hypothetical protein